MASVAASTTGDREGQSLLTNEVNGVSYGAKGSQVDAADGLVPALEAAFEGGGVHLVAVPVDYSENIRVLVEELRRAVPVARSS